MGRGENILGKPRKQYKLHCDISFLKPSNDSHLGFILYSLSWHTLSWVLFYDFISHISHDFPRCPSFNYTKKKN